MIKLVGFVIILFSAIKIGFDVSQKYINRSKELKSIIIALELMCKELNFTTPNMGDVLLSASKVNCENIKQLFVQMSDAVKSNIISPFEAFENCRNNIYFSINNKDLQILSDYFSVCGSGCVDDELNSIKYTVSLLNNNLDWSLADEKKYVKLYRFTGLVFGLMISIILI